MVSNATFQQYFSYIMEGRFIGGGNRSTRWKPQTCRKSLTNFHDMDIKSIIKIIIKPNENKEDINKHHVFVV
jgi:hypothetical protein